MARTPGSKTTNSPSLIKNIGGDNEDVFLSEMLSGRIRWKAAAAALKQAGHDAARELEYAEAYKVLLNKFSADED